jgi:hypothetical protein
LTFTSTTAGVLGGLASALASAVLVKSNDSLLGAHQPARQLAAIACTMAVALTSGYLAGWLVGAINPCKQKLAEADLFEDVVFWSKVVPEAKCASAGQMRAAQPYQGWHSPCASMGTGHGPV